MNLSEDELKIDRELSVLDKKVLKFASILDSQGIDYVIVSGYIPILVGRSRGTEDVDFIIEELDQERLLALIEILDEKGYWCINTELEQIREMLKEGLSVRLAEEDEVIPNFEIFYPQDQFDRVSLENSIHVDLREGLEISPLELQIAYKLYLGSEKDFEDALHLYKVFEQEIDTKKLENFVTKLEVGDKLDELRRT